MLSHIKKALGIHQWSYKSPLVQICVRTCGTCGRREILHELCGPPNIFSQWETFDYGDKTKRCNKSNE